MVFEKSSTHNIQTHVFMHACDKLCTYMQTGATCMHIHLHKYLSHSLKHNLTYAPSTYKN